MDCLICATISGGKVRWLWYCLLAQLACAPVSPLPYADINHADRFANLINIRVREMIRKKMRKSSPLDVKQWYIVKALDHLLLHLPDCRCTPHDPKLKFGSSPVLLNEVQFTVVFGIKITQMATA